VVDDAHILSDQTKTDLDQKLAALEQKTSRQLVVVTLSSLQAMTSPITAISWAAPGHRPGQAQQWGAADRRAQRASRSHRSGLWLEPIITDALSEVIIQQRCCRNSAPGFQWRRGGGG